MNDALYQARILDHYKHPRNKRELSDANVMKKGANPSCGDMLAWYLKFDGGTIVEATFTGEGCAISQSAASLLTEKVTGMKKTVAAKLTEQDVYDMLGVEVSGGRKKCALLAWNALQKGLKDDE